jgi:hypothetical protein
MKNGPSKHSKMAQNMANFRSNPAFPCDEELKDKTVESWGEKIVTVARDLHDKFCVLKSHSIEKITNNFDFTKLFGIPKNLFSASFPDANLFSTAKDVVIADLINIGMIFN